MRIRRLGRLGVFAVCVAGVSSVVSAAELVNNDAYDLTWTNTVVGTIGMRAGSPASVITNRLSNNDGDLSFKRGDLITKRTDLLSELSLRLHNENELAFRLSGTAWYDGVYRGSHAPLAVSQSNAYPTTGLDRFTDSTRHVLGLGAELSDAFVQGKGELFDRNVHFRLGRHTLLWGENMFINNGVSWGMAPFNGAKAPLMGQPLLKELSMPETKLSGTVELDHGFSLEGYYNMEFRTDRVAPAGSYFSTFDGIGDGGNKIIAAQIAGLSSAACTRGVGGEALTGVCRLNINRVSDKRAPNFGKDFGVALRYSDPANDRDWGFYYVHAPSRWASMIQGPKSNDPGSVGTYQWIYPQDVNIVGASLNTSLFEDFNLGGEVSMRWNMPFSQNTVSYAYSSIPTGKSLHGQASLIRYLKPNGLWDAGIIMGEVAVQHLVSVDDGKYLTNPTTGAKTIAIDPTAARTAVGFSGFISPTWTQVFPDVDINAAIGATMTLTKRSAVDNTFNFNYNHGGHMQFTVGAVYQTAWSANVTYRHYVGSKTQNIAADRDYVLASVKRSF
ncbi:DUF1302 domain-containing protein [Azospirillum griseum]|uniref:DUF1302 family protein n=1 Tax=Azospirillum griseum TaxID=2496639 RepID=A0A431VAK2_9PROT|nr:DUF1302 family protein [Azospirillum griseum]RTR14617.1 DUF1302 family protein [Azospirillum griseum]